MLQAEDDLLTKIHSGFHKTVPIEWRTHKVSVSRQDDG